MLREVYVSLFASLQQPSNLKTLLSEVETDSARLHKLLLLPSTPPHFKRPTIVRNPLLVNYDRTGIDVA